MEDALTLCNLLFSLSNNSWKTKTLYLLKWFTWMMLGFTKSKIFIKDCIEIVHAYVSLGFLLFKKQTLQQ